MWPVHIGGSVKNLLKAVARPPVVFKLNVTTASRFWRGGGILDCSVSEIPPHPITVPNLISIRGSSHSVEKEGMMYKSLSPPCPLFPPFLPLISNSSQLHRVTPHSLIWGWKPISSKGTSRYHIIISLHLFRCLRCDGDKRENPSSHLLFTSFLLTTYFFQFFSHHLFLKSSASDNNFLQSEAEKGKSLKLKFPEIQTFYAAVGAKLTQWSIIPCTSCLATFNPDFCFVLICSLI